MKRLFVKAAGTMRRSWSRSECAILSQSRSSTDLGTHLGSPFCAICDMIFRTTCQLTVALLAVKTGELQEVPSHTMQELSMQISTEESAERFGVSLSSRKYYVAQICMRLHEAHGYHVSRVDGFYVSEIWPPL